MLDPYGIDTPVMNDFTPPPLKNYWVHYKEQSMIPTKVVATRYNFNPEATLVSFYKGGDTVAIFNMSWVLGILVDD